MNLQKIYIISYFGDNSVRDKRKHYHRQQLDWCANQNLDIFVLAQDYYKSDYDDRVTYIQHDNSIVLPSVARNICLRHFYASDCNFAIFADNDCVLHTGPKYGDSTNFVQTFNSIDLKKLNGVDFFYPLNPGRMPFSKMIAENTELFNNYLNFQRGMEPKSMYVLKNLVKFYNTPIFFDEINFTLQNGYMIAHEDTDFACQLLTNGYSVYRLNNIILKEFGSNNSTWLNQKDIKRKLSAETGRDILCRKYNLLRKNNRMSFRPLYHISNNKPILNISKNA